MNWRRRGAGEVLERPDTYGCTAVDVICALRHMTIADGCHMHMRLIRVLIYKSTYPVLNIAVPIPGTVPRYGTAVPITELVTELVTGI